MLRNATIHMGDARRGGGGVAGLMGLVMAAALVGLLIVFLVQARETWLMTSPDVQRAEAQARVSDAHHRAAESERQAAQARAEEAAAASWTPWTEAAKHLAMIVGLAALAAFLVAGPLGAALLFRRHLSLPTRDGRVPLVGLDRE